MSRRGKRGGKRDDDGRRVRETSEERFVRASNVTYKHANIPSVVGITADGKALKLAIPKDWQGAKTTLVVVDEVNEYWDSLPKESR